MPVFDLSREPWIPVLSRDGPCDVSLRDALAESHTLTAVAAGSPLETAALYRLLQAVFLDLFGKTTYAPAAWQAMYDAGRLTDAEVRKVDAYFERHRDRFDLLHPERPFYQHPAPQASTPSPLAKLFGDESSGNNPTLFDHALDDEARRLPLAVAARGLVATQATALGGGRSTPFYYSDAPLAAGAIFWIRGGSLFESLLLNSPPGPNARIRSDGYDAPAWRRDDVQEPAARGAEGYLDYLTWQARLLRLETTGAPDAPVTATAVWMSQGDKLNDDALRDPLMAYRRSKDGKVFPLKLNTDRALWRDAHVFMERYAPASGGAPPAVQWVLNSLPEKAWTVDVFGMANDKAKIELWRHEQLPFYRALLLDGDDAKARRSTLQLALDRARLQARNLGDGCLACAARLLFPDADPDALGRQARDDARTLAASLDAETRYWARLEVPFLEWLGTLAATPQDGLDRVLAAWTRTLHHTALRAYDEATASLEASARQLKACTLGRSRVRPPAAYAALLQPATPEASV